MPDPVVPAIRPCGPSRTRSMSTVPSSDHPIVATGAGSGPPSAQRRAIASAVSAPAGNSCCSATMRDRPVRAASWSSGSTSDDNRLATRSAVVVPTPATWTPPSPSTDWSRHCPTPVVPNSRTSEHTDGMLSPRGVMTTATAPVESMNRRSGPVRATSAPGWSVTTTIALSVDPASRSVSGAVSCSVWGSQVVHSQSSGRFVSITRRQSAGPYQVASCTMIERANAVARSRSPWSAVTSPGRSASGTATSPSCSDRSTATSRSGASRDRSSALIGATRRQVPRPRVARSGSCAAESTFPDPAVVDSQGVDDAGVIGAMVARRRRVGPRRGRARAQRRRADGAPRPAARAGGPRRHRRPMSRATPWRRTARTRRTAAVRGRPP